MKLLTHNMLTSNIIKGVTKGFPLLIEVTKIEEREIEFSSDFIARMVPKLEWDALVSTATSIDKGDQLPVSPPEDYENDEEFLRCLHHVLLEVELMDGHLVCPESGRKFPVSNGIPNMLLNEDEVP